jgi:peptidoglycan hydrolase-like amidase
VAAACRTMQQGAPPRVLPSPSLDGFVEPPVVRVGILPEVPRVSIGADGGVRVLAREPGGTHFRWRPLPRATFRPDGQGRLKLLETGETLAGATVVPADASKDLLDADARPYRGLLEVRPAEEGTLTVVDVVNIEDYLRGVVPNELSPLAFPEIEALKAQAVAARTWVLSHRGDYAAKGYDVCATPACQVYRGQASEQPLTDEAVKETRGIIATWRGRPIHAYYTSTCGGHTEDGENIFDDPAPYLRGVVCLPERSARHRIHTKVAPRRGLPGPRGLARSLAVLEALGVVDDSAADPARLAGMPADGEIRRWMQDLLRGLHRTGCASPVTGALARRASFVHFAVSSLCWQERARRLLAPADADYLLQVADADRLKGEGERRAMALLVHQGIVSPRPDNTLHPDGAVTRGEALHLLAGLADEAGSPSWRSGQLTDLENGLLSVRQGDSSESLPLDPAVRLFRSLEGVYAGTSDLALTLGEDVSYVVRDGRVVYLEVPQTRLGASADRTSRYYRWETRLTPADVTRSVARYGSVGEVRDLVPRRLGVSGRVVELDVEGTEGDLLLKGLKVRWGLGLRENLFVIDRERDDAGGVEEFVITGRGWGHGVGLCQVGAFGMARSGSSYEEILHHYYTGIQLSDDGAFALPDPRVALHGPAVEATERTRLAEATSPAP